MAGKTGKPPLATLAVTRRNSGMMLSKEARHTPTLPVRLHLY